MNLIVYFSMSWVKLGDLLDGYLGKYLIKKKERERIKLLLFCLGYSI
jgi:hypothetical protein